jgi:hypothetical protein
VSIVLVKPKQHFKEKNMKKLFRNALMLAGMGSALFFTSCDDTVEEPVTSGPSVTITTSETSYSAGATAEFDISFRAEAELIGATLTVESDNDVTFDPVVLDLNSIGVASDTLGEFTVTLTIPQESLNSEATVTVEIEDGENRTAQSSVSFDVVASINTYESVLFGAQGNTEEGFYNSLDNERYTFAEARDASTVNSSPVDFAYYWGNDDKNTLASIDDGGLQAVYKATNSNLDIAATFGTRNSTRFRVTSLSPEDFDGIESESALVSAADSELNTNSSATNLSVGSVVAFELDADRGGYLGLAKVTAINDTNGNGTITIEVKVQSAE